MPKLSGSGILRYDVHDTEDLGILIRTGMVWVSGPKVLKLALSAITAGDIERPVHNVPEWVDTYLDRLGVSRPS